MPSAEAAGPAEGLDDDGGGSADVGVSGLGEDSQKEEAAGLAGTNVANSESYVDSVVRSNQLLPGNLLFDVLEKVLSFLSPSELKHPRRVNSVFCAAACNVIYSITMLEPCQLSYDPLRLQRIVFPRLAALAVHLKNVQELIAWADPLVAPRITHLILSSDWNEWSGFADPRVRECLNLLCNLGILTVHSTPVDASNRFRLLLPELLSLRHIQVCCKELEDFSALQQMPNLTSLDVAYQCVKPAADREVLMGEGVGFAKLQSLRIAGSFNGPIVDLVGLLSRGTGLTHLTWVYKGVERGNGFPGIRTVAPLLNLKALCFKPSDFRVYGLRGLLHIAPLTGLTKLHFALGPSVGGTPGSTALSPLSLLTCLRNLKVWATGCFVDVLTNIHIESLCRLELGPRWNAPGREGCAVLRRATNLSCLCFHAREDEVDEDLGRVIGGLTRLCSIDVQYRGREGDVGKCVIRSADLALLKSRTYVKLRGVIIDHADMASLATALGNPAWYTESPETVTETAEGHISPRVCKVIRCSSGLVSPHGSDVLGVCNLKGGEGRSRIDPWAIVHSIDDEEEGYFGL